MNVHWTEAALADLQAIEAYIGRHSPQYAHSMLERIFSRSEQLTDQPQLGPVVPEYNDESLRELFEDPYRIIYRVLAQQIDIVTVVHGARRLPARLVMVRSWRTQPSEVDSMSFTLAQLQQVIRDTYGAKDRRRGVEGTFMWLMQEVGELATALRSGSHEEQAQEFADVLAWLATIANTVGVDLEAAVQAKYGTGCPGCRQIPCVCDQAEKP